MAILFNIGGNSSGTANLRQVTFTTTADTFAVGYLYSRSAGSVTSIIDTQGNVWQEYLEVGAGPFQSLWYTNLATGAITINCNINASVACAFLVNAYTGANAITEISPTYTGIGTTVDSGSITVHQAFDSMVVACMGTSTNTPAITNPGGYTQEQSTGNIHARMCDLFQAGLGTYDPQYTLDVSDTWNAMTFAIQNTVTNQLYTPDSKNFGFNF